MRHIVSFLGGAAGQGPKDYRLARYRFADGRESAQVKFFAQALLHWLRTTADGPKAAPTDLHIFGTTTSMWDALLDLVIEQPNLDHAAWEAVETAVRSGGTTQAALAALVPDLQGALGAGAGKLRVHLRIITLAETEAEQHAVLDALADAAPSGQVWIDVTHGFRHLPILAAVSALHLRLSRGVRIEGVFYGALEMTKSPRATPVIDLRGMLGVGEAIGALGAYRRTGDLRALADAMQAGGLDTAIAKTMRDAAHAEQVLDLRRAIQGWRAVANALQQPHSGAAELVRRDVLQSLSWALQPRVSDQLRGLALQRAEYAAPLAALTLGVEACVAKRIEAAGGDPLAATKAQRDEARDALRQAGEGVMIPARPADLLQALKKHPHLRFRVLNALRNSLAHVDPDPPGSWQHALLAQPADLRDAIRLCLT
jgi:CRISPR-associated Csx2 family protein